MRHLTILALILVTGCEGYDAPEIDNTALRGHAEGFQDIGEIQVDTVDVLRPGRGFGGSVGRPAKAHIGATCLDEYCLEILYSSAESTNATTFAWTLNGAPFSNDPDVVLSLSDDDFAVLDLAVTGPNGADSTTMATLNSPMDYVPGPFDEVPPGRSPIWATVVVGVQSCNDLIVVASLGGCLTSPAPTVHRARRDVNGSVRWGDFTFDPQSISVTDIGLAEGAVWRPQVLGAEYFAGFAYAAVYGPTRQYGNVVPLGAQHISSYYDADGGILSVAAHHFAYQAAPASTAINQLDIDCTNGIPVLSSSAF